MRIIALLIILFSTTSFAQVQTSETTVNTDAVVVEQRSFSENLYFPGETISRISFTPTFSSSTYRSTSKFSGDIYSYEFISQINKLTYQYGFASFPAAILLSTGFGTKSAESLRERRTREFQYSGMTDLNLSLMGILQSDDLNIQYGALATYSPQEARYAYTNSTGNMFSGGHSFTPVLAIEMKLNSVTAGFVANYRFTGKRTTIGNPGDLETETGGNMATTKVFTEVEISKHLIGASAAYQMLEDSEIKDSENDQYHIEKEQSYTLSAYGRLAATKQISFVPTITYQKNMTALPDYLTFKKDESTAFSIAGAYAF